MTTPLEAVAWIHGAADCDHCADPPIQVHAFNDDTYILRLSKCLSYEGNFIYLLFGADRAIVFDTGPRLDPDHDHGIIPIRATLEAIIAARLAARAQAGIDLIVAHTHGHGDHAYWDSQFDGRLRTTIVAPTLPWVKAFYGLVAWPDGEAQLDLGGRQLTVFPIPGHEESHIAIYDAATKILLTGDTLYPGRLTIQDWPAYRASAARLAAFARRHEIGHVLGNHIEMTATPGRIYPIPCNFQPHEHALPLTAAHIEELHLACEAMADAPRRDVHDDFIIGEPY